jgi:hypothetical protein
MTALVGGLVARAPARAWLIVYGALVAFTIWLVLTANAEPYDWNAAGVGHDARPYWSAPADDSYRTSRVGAHDAYLYSPAFLQAIQPLRALPWEAFFSAWTLILLGAGLAVVGPLLLGPVLLLVLPELIGGNVTLLLALAVVGGFRWPGLWSFVLLTKVTPGIGLLWFAVRREWSALWIALAATVAIVLISTVAAPAAWREWFAVLVQNVGSPVTSGSIPIPVPVRFPIAIAMIVWGARTNRRWVLPVAALLSLPVIWYGSLSLLVAVIPLSGRLRGWTWAAALQILRSRFPSDARRDPEAGATA